MNLQNLLKMLDEIKENIDKKQFKKLKLSITERIIKRLYSFSNECEECESYLNSFGKLIEEMIKKDVFIVEKELKLLIKSVTTHLQKKHKLVTDNYYTNTYMSYGIALGLPFGVVFSQLLKQPAFIGIGLPIGMSIGVAIGTELDKKAKEEGLLI